MKFLHFLAAITTIALAATLPLSCQKSDTPTNPPPGPGHRPEYVTASINGRVVDDQRAPVEGATVKAGNTTATTDLNGNFSFQNVSVDKTAALIRIEKNGYFTGIKTLVVSPNRNHQVTIELIPKTVTGTFSSTAGGTIHLPKDGGTVVFEANSMMNTANNAGYTGEVAVSAFFINPTAGNFSDIMPGTLRGIDSANHVRGLQSLGMMAVELSGSNGEKLQLAGGKKATIRFPIPAALQGEAPAIIPLWSLQDSTGLWKQEGTATRQGNEYVGIVQHFSFWNVDVPYPLVDLSATLSNQGTPLAFSKVIITGTGENANISGSGFTDENGAINGLIPANTALVLKVVDQCNNVIHTQNIGPFTAAANLGNITVNAPNYIVTLTGTVTNCSNAAVTNGHVAIEMDNGVYKAMLSNGAFSVTLSRCTNTPTTAAITAHDITGNQSSATASVSISGATANAGTLIACGNLPDQYIYYSVNDKPYAFTVPADTIATMINSSGATYYTDISGRSRTTYPPFFDLGLEGPDSPGTHNVLVLSFSAGSTIWERNGTFNANVTSWVISGGFIEGSFTGSVKEYGNPTNTAPVSCSFRVRRW